MKVSFIIPIYKVEQYIDQCVESILCQTYSDIEVMLVDDGSPDNCPAKCDEWAKRDSRVKALHKLNGGLSDARNYGLEYATGEYVVFVDGDDFWLGKDNLEHLVAKAKEFPEVDFIGFNCSYYYSDSNTCKPWAKYVDELAKPHSNSETICLLTKTSSIVMSAWTKMIKKHVLIENKVNFKRGQLSEDIPWFINLLEASQSSLFVNEYVYAYRQGVAGSITHNIGQRNIDSLIDILETEIAKIEFRKITQEAKFCLYSFLAYEYSIILGYLDYLDRELAENKYQYLKQYSYLLNYTKDPKVKKVAIAKKLFGLRVTAKLLQLRIKRMKN